jgi:hypothetical protein
MTALLFSEVTAHRKTLMLPSKKLPKITLKGNAQYNPNVFEGALRMISFLLKIAMNDNAIMDDIIMLTNSIFKAGLSKFCKLSFLLFKKILLSTNKNAKQILPKGSSHKLEYLSLLKRKNMGMQYAIEQTMLYFKSRNRDFIYKI